MTSERHRDLWRYLRHCASVLGVVSLSVLATLVVQHLLIPPPVAPQPAGVQEVRASAFVLVGAGGTVLGRLAPDGAGNGRLTLYNTTGQKRAELTGDGFVGFYDGDGQNLRVALGLSTILGPGIQVLAADGTTARIRMGVSASTGNPGIAILDENGTTRRVGVGELPTGDFGVAVFDKGGQPLATLP